jgi:hypothetical protein
MTIPLQDPAIQAYSEAFHQTRSHAAGVRAVLRMVADQLTPVNGSGYVASPPDARAIRALLTGEQR